MNKDLLVLQSDLTGQNVGAEDPGKSFLSLKRRQLSSSVFDVCPSHHLSVYLYVCPFPVKPDEPYTIFNPMSTVFAIPETASLRTLLDLVSLV